MPAFAGMTQRTAPQITRIMPDLAVKNIKKRQETAIRPVLGKWGVCAKIQEALSPCGRSLLFAMHDDGL
jgi:hypothetical protein